MRLRCGWCHSSQCEAITAVMPPCSGPDKAASPAPMLACKLAPVEATTRAAKLEAGVAQSLAQEWGLKWEHRELPREVREPAAALEAKYRSEAWIRRR